MTDSFPTKTFEQIYKQHPYFSVEELFEYKSKIDDLITAMELNLKQTLCDQEQEFQKTFNNQMKMVKDTFAELKSKIDQTLTKEQNNSKYANLFKEKVFFMKHSLFLNDQNKLLTTKIRELQDELKNMRSERDYFQNKVKSMQKPENESDLFKKPSRLWSRSKKSQAFYIGSQSMNKTSLKNEAYKSQATIFENKQTNILIEVEKQPGLLNRCLIENNPKNENLMKGSSKLPIKKKSLTLKLNMTNPFFITNKSSSFYPKEKQVEHNALGSDSEKINSVFSHHKNIYKNKMGFILSANKEVNFQQIMSESFMKNIEQFNAQKDKRKN